MSKRSTDPRITRYRQEDRRRLVGIIEADGYGALSKDDFYKNLKFTAQYHEIPNNLLGSLEVRMKSGQIGSRELFIILLDSIDSGDWKKVKIMALEYLFSNRHLANEIFTVAEANMVCDIVSHQIIGEGSQGDVAEHKVVAKVACDGKQYSSPITYARNLKQAKQLANCYLLVRLADVEFEPKNFAPTANIDTKEDPAINPAIEETLNKWCQQRKLPFPEILLFRTGEQHTSSFEAVASVVIGDVTHQSETHTGKKMKEARRLAANDLYAKLQEVIKTK